MRYKLEVKYDVYKFTLVKRKIDSVNMFMAEDLNGVKIPVTREWIQHNKDSIVNVLVKSDGRIQYKGTIEEDVFNFWRFYWGNESTGKSTISKVLEERYLTNLEGLKKKGYDGVIIRNAPVGIESRLVLKYEILAFYPEQIKSIYNKKPLNTADIYDNSVVKSKKVTAAQKLFFKDSKIKDKDGNLLVCYHSTSENFSTFSLDYLDTGHGSCFGAGFYFSSEPIVEYGRVMKVFLNITNPYIIENVYDFEDVLKYIKACYIRKK